MTQVVPSMLGTDTSRFQATVRRNRFEEDQMRLVLASVLSSNSNAVDIGAHGGTVLREIIRCAPRVATWPMSHSLTMQRDSLASSPRWTYARSLWLTKKAR